MKTVLGQSIGLNLTKLSFQVDSFLAQTHFSAVEVDVELGKQSDVFVAVGGFDVDQVAEEEQEQQNDDLGHFFAAQEAPSRPRVFGRLASISLP